MSVIVESYPKLHIYVNQKLGHKYVISVEKQEFNLIRANVYDETDESDDPPMVAQYSAHIYSDEAVWDMKDLSARFNNARIECIVIKREIVKIDLEHVITELKRYL